MEKQIKDFKRGKEGLYSIIARTVGVSPKYASMVIRGKLGKYNDRDTDLVKQIRKLHAEIESVLNTNAK
jgi:hypothetical protein